MVKRAPQGIRAARNLAWRCTTGILALLRLKTIAEIQGFFLYTIFVSAFKGFC
jgi:hypothetical protein